MGHGIGRQKKSHDVSFVRHEDGGNAPEGAASYCPARLILSPRTSVAMWIL